MMKMKGTYLNTLRWVWERGKDWLLLSIILNIVSGLVPVASVWISRELINDLALFFIQRSAGETHILLLLLAQFAISMLASALQNWQGYLNRSMDVKMDYELQKTVNQKSSAVAVGYFDNPEFYNHLNRIRGSFGSRFLTPVRNLMEIGRTLITLCSFFGYLLSIHWLLAVLSVVGAIPTMIVQLRMGNRKFLLQYMQSPLARDAGYTSNLLQDRGAAKEIRLFRLAEHLNERWQRNYLKNAFDSLRLLRSQMTAQFSLDGTTGMSYMLSALVILWLLGRASIRIGDFVAIGQAVQESQNAINRISTLMAGIYESGLYVRDFFRFLDYDTPTMQTSEGTVAFPVPLTQGIELRNVSFCYEPSGRPSLQHLSIHIRPGEKVAIVGANGSGKTTLVKCLLGLYPVSSGEILFDGRPLQTIEPGDLRKNITVIFQDFMKYGYTLKENIGFGDVESMEQDEAIREVAVSSGVDEFAGTFAHGYETYLGRILQEGVDLSGGQWQKVALARALFSPAQVLILDEPTAAMDPLSEREAFRQFEELAGNKTIVMISHRMAAARMAGRILVMKDGRLVESGTHEELIALGQEYFKMYQLQAAWYEDGKEREEEGHGDGNRPV